MKSLFIASLMVTSLASAMAEKAYTFGVLTEKEISPLIPFIAQQRLSAFSEFPYLYYGTMATETPYLKLYAHNKDAAIALAYWDDDPVGLLTGMPFLLFDEHLPSKEIFKKRNLHPEKCYSFGEVIVLPQHRRKGLCKRLFTILENHAKKLGYTTFSFLTVNRTENDPQKPKGYKSEEALWQGLGYTKTSMMISCSWKTYQLDGSLKKRKHTLTYWIKQV